MNAVLRWRVRCTTLSLTSAVGCLSGCERLTLVSRSVVAQPMRFYASPRQRHGASARAKAPRGASAGKAALERKPRPGKKHTGPPPPSSSPVTTTRSPKKKKTKKTASTPGPSAVTSATVSGEEQRMVENDTRLAMRMLMTRHLAREGARHRPEERRREAQREALRLQQGDRLRRLEQKTQNSMALLGPDAATVGDGVLPYFLRDDKVREGAPLLGSPEGTAPRRASGTRAAKSLPVWLQNNAVSSAVTASTTTLLTGEDQKPWLDDDDDDVDALASSHTLTDAATERGGVRAVSLDYLCKPDLSVYDSTLDQRISSEDVLRREEEMVRLKRDAGIVFEDEGVGDGTAPGVVGGDVDDDDTKAEREMAQLLRTTAAAEEAGAVEGGDALPMSLYAVSRRAAVNLRTQLWEREEEEDGDETLAMPAYDDDADNDQSTV